MIQAPLGQNKISQLSKEAKSLFIRQNTATSRVMILTMDQEDTLLEDAEQAMQEACAELNAYAVRLRDDLGDNLLQQQQVFSSLAACDAATEQLETLLQSGAYD